MRAPLICILFLFLAAPANAFLEQFGPGDLVYEVALAVEGQGCVASQDEWARLFEEKGRAYQRFPSERCDYAS